MSKSTEPMTKQQLVCTVKVRQFEPSIPGQWFWVLYSPSGKPIAESSGYYKTRSAAVRAFHGLAKTMDGGYFFEDNAP